MEEERKSKMTRNQTHQGDKHMKLRRRPLRLMLKERAIVQEDEELKNEAGMLLLKNERVKLLIFNGIGVGWTVISKPIR
ncbi:hypothetical protein Pyn_40228 [Prunus yedoensis var. nudiflora]|uniref:Uncharacterized protein n=1 Tax=Prunus yedoensis var. nudiflora TaxID=2094558 RepID=A0A314YB93_PRUYE|nr:hypothetical protein Pyn_40228 [Prunus yedoensis var. nudiflora]